MVFFDVVRFFFGGIRRLESESSSESTMAIALIFYSRGCQVTQSGKVAISHH